MTSLEWILTHNQSWWPENLLGFVANHPTRAFHPLMLSTMSNIDRKRNEHKVICISNAYPNPDEYRHHDLKCLTDQEAVDIVNAFESFYVSFDAEKAERLIADEFQSLSDSNSQPSVLHKFHALSFLRARLPTSFKMLFSIFPINITRLLLPSTAPNQSFQLGSAIVPSKAQFHGISRLMG
ncbi:hypothetical protein GJ744_011554 [Endocarpon pusillum]|uniref:NTF2-like domain-containing protein n=1 Tax=Endocarpon pusillum TaxID=364733 RepID=A0A8H7E256_9EURO|nr:hypothetical protein GJ744_011554 [Endocarpon pusillum]